jgi:hypothetical protein
MTLPAHLRFLDPLLDVLVDEFHARYRAMEQEGAVDACSAANLRSHHLKVPTAGANAGLLVNLRSQNGA